MYQDVLNFDLMVLCSAWIMLNRTNQKIITAQALHKEDMVTSGNGSGSLFLCVILFVLTVPVKQLKYTISKKLGREVLIHLITYSHYVSLVIQYVLEGASRHVIVVWYDRVRSPSSF